jgi:hypothetical protein
MTPQSIPRPSLLVIILLLLAFRNEAMACPSGFTGTNCDICLLGMAWLPLNRCFHHLLPHHAVLPFTHNYAVVSNSPALSM